MNAPLQKKNKRVRGVVVSLIIFVLLTGAVALGVGLYSQLGPVDSQNKQEKLFVIKPGSSLIEITHNLKKEGFLKSSRVFLLYTRLTGNTSKIKAGEYLLNPALDVPKLTEKLVKGEVATITFTIPEGYHLRQIAQVFVKQGIATEEEFWKVVREGEFEYTFLADLPPTERRLEGYLFPDTYTIAKGMPVKEVIKMMLKRFDTVYKRLPPNETGLTTHEVVTLASIIEGESVVNKERAVIASVFFNRLKIGQRLEADATVQYLFDERKEQVLYRDLEIDSPYNTYRHQGLPPGPIGSPGEASLQAVLEPQDTKYYYFVARKDNSGEHVFARTLDEHNRNKRNLGYR